MSGAVQHPYLPKDIKLPNYRPNETSMEVILLAFFGPVALLMLAVWLYTGTCKALRGTWQRLQACWFFQCAVIHIVLEGYFALYHGSLVGSQSYLAQMWKEYSIGDSRYVTSDACIVAIETLTAVFDGPMCALAFYALLRNAPYRHMVMTLVCTCQLYGAVVYFYQEALEDFRHGIPNHPQYFWFYIVFLNGIWIVVPGAIIVNSVAECSAAQALKDKQPRTKRQ